MNDDDNMFELDARVRAALNPETEAARRVVMRALADADAKPQRQRRLRVALLSAAVLALLAGAGLQWRRGSNHAMPPALAITGEGSMVVVESEDGRRWIVGPPATRNTRGSYVIVFSGTEERK
jgi:ferric-dicitrate binding protein FerR (iron transport regulator)